MPSANSADYFMDRSLGNNRFIEISKLASCIRETPGTESEGINIMKHSLRTAAALAACSAGLLLTTGAQAQTAGSVSATITSPVAVSGTAAAPGLSCVVRPNAKTYNVKITQTSVDGYTITGNGTITGYTGPGSYTATMSVTLTGNGKNLAGAGKKVPVTITETGGSAAFSKSTAGTSKTSAKSFVGSIGWGCPTA
jgi:hypothetical protein